MEVYEKVTLEDIVFRFNPYSAFLEYNPHRNLYQTIEEYFDSDRSVAKFIDYEECVKKNSVYVLRVYPHTAVGFYEISGSDYEAVMYRMIEVLHNDI